MMEEDTRLALQALLEYQFKEPELLHEALRHPSYAHEHPDRGDNNQRLEFLGDAALGLVVAENLVRRLPEAREGDLTRWRAALVSERPLARFACQLGLGDYLLLGRGEDANGGRTRPSVLADLVEAVVGAAFLDGGLGAARQVVGTVMGDRVERVHEESRPDPKSLVQEQIQSVSTEPPAYHLIRALGPDHAKRFEVELRLGERVLGRGVGTSKKNAEKAAALEALDHLELPQEDHP